MQNLSILLCFGMMFLFTCTHHETNETDCTSTILKQYKMVPFTGQTNYCESLVLYEYQDQPYFVYDCCVCDLIPNPVDCDNQSYCLTNGEYDENKCQLFLKRAGG